MSILAKVAVLSIALVLLVNVQAALGDYSKEYSTGVEGSQGDYSVKGSLLSDYSHGRVKRQNGPFGTWGCLPTSCQLAGCSSGNCGFWCRSCGIAG